MEGDPRGSPTVPLPDGTCGCRFCGIEHTWGSPECPAAFVGKTIAGKYAIRRLLGVGGMGAVYEAEHLKLKRGVAIKRLHGRSSTDPETAARFHREAQRLATLEHPGIVRVADFGHDESGAAYIEMELLRGRSVVELLAGGPVPVALALRIAVGALDALDAAHAANIVHRDLKPDNLFLVDGTDGIQVKILDFGIAKQTASITAAAITKTGASFGTPLYMSPEQLQDTKNVDARSDLWAIGATLFELLTGRPSARGESAFEVISRIAIGNVDRHPRLFRADVPEWLDAIVARAMEQDPAQRFESAATMAVALRTGMTASGQRPRLATTRVAAAPVVAQSRVAEPVLAPAAPSARPVPSASSSATQAWSGSVPPGATTTSPVIVGRQSPGPPPRDPRTRSVGLEMGIAAGCVGVLMVASAGFAIWGLGTSEAGPAQSAALAVTPRQSRPTPRANPCPSGTARVEGASSASPFCIDRTEVTAAAYRRCVEAGRCAAAEARVTSNVPSDELERYRGFCTGPRDDRADHPINCIDALMAESYCRWRSERLPTDAEWELAARGPTGRRYPWGNWAPGSNVVNACGPECVLRRQRQRRGYLPRPGGDAFPTTMPVGALLQGAADCGALDLAGNVAEWVGGEVGPTRLARGGSWMDDPVEGVQGTARRMLDASARLPEVGFRCATDVPR